MSEKLNIALIIFDLIFLPIIILRLVLIYFFGSKYNVKGMEFLDVMSHASKEYFNQEDGVTIDVLNEDVRATIKRETKLFKDHVEINVPVKNFVAIQDISTVQNINKTDALEELPPIINPIILEQKLEQETQQKMKHIMKTIQLVCDKSENNTETESDIELNDNSSDNLSDESSDIESYEETEIEESERVLNTDTDESHSDNEEKEIRKIRNRMNKSTNFDLDVHIDKLFDDLENSITTITQTDKTEYTENTEYTETENSETHSYSN